MKILAFESSCDETAVAVVEDGRRVLSDAIASQADMHALYGGAVTLSASRMDMARSCHFAYFMRYGLKARERTGAGFDAPQIGTFVHDVMEHTLRQAKECGGLHTLSKDKLHALVRASIEEYIDRVLPDLCEKSARFRYLFNGGIYRIRHILQERGSRIRIESSPEISVEVDGELLGESPLEFSVLHRAVRIVVSEEFLKRESYPLCSCNIV
jgi:ATP-dependent helicase/nuclease subunit B